MQQAGRLCLLSLNQSLRPLRCTPIVFQARSLSLSSRRMEEAMEHLKSNPYFEKYASKISKVKENNPDELVSAVQKRKVEIKSEATNATAAAAGVKKISSKADKPKKPLPSGAYGYAPVKKLDSIMKLELLKDKDADEVTFLWTQHFKTQPVICGVMKADLYHSISSNSQKYDKFLFPLPREQGYEFIFAQFAAQEVHFTPLINYQAYGENAPECLAMVHYPDLKEKLGIVLMKGDYDSNIISGKEAQFLANQVQLYYSGQDAKKMELVKKFHIEPHSFTHMDLVKELEQLDLGGLALEHKKS